MLLALPGAVRAERVEPAALSAAAADVPAAPDATAPSAVDAAAPAGWLGLAQRAIAEREYRASEGAQGLQAPNRAHGLRTWFEKQGIRVHDRTAGGSPELLRLSLSGVGRGDRLAAVLPAEDVVASGSRVEIRRPGLTEWYVNSAAGLEQGFTLSQRPQGEGPLVMELEISAARASLRGEHVALSTGAGRKLDYAKLAAFEASGRALASHFELPTPQRLRIVVEDAAAVYPLTIDPLLTQAPDTQLESNQANAQLGYSVAAAGDVNGDGYADVIVGSPFYDAGQSDEGAAFVFHGTGASIVPGIPDGDPLGAAAQLESNQASAWFGWSVASAGDVNGDGYADVIVGSRFYDAGQADEGAAFVFHGSASGVADGNPATAPTQLESNQAGAYLGSSVASAGDVNADGYADVIVGALYYDAGQADEGAAFVFHGSGSGVADGNPLTAPTQLESNQASAQFGASVASAGDVNGDGRSDVLVGAPEYDSGETDEGAAFVFHGSGSGVADGHPGTAPTQLESDQASADFGWSVASAGDVNGDGYADAIVGAYRYDAGETNEGAAFVFRGSASGIADADPSTIGVARLESDQSSAWFGYSVSGVGDVNGDGYADVIVGALTYDAGESDEGGVFVFLGTASGVDDGDAGAAFAQLESNQAGAWLGGSVAGAGDVDNDGYADVIAGAHFYDAGAADEGAAFVFHGGAEGIQDGNPVTASAQLESNQANAQLGYSVASAGDVNGDGYADVIVGARLYDAGETDEGAAFVFHGSASGVGDGNPAAAAAQLESNQASAWFGWSVASAGDVNGDGYADVIVGALEYDAGQEDEGAAFVFHGGASGIGDGSPSTAAAQLESDDPLTEFGTSVASAGDVNGDGYADVIVGASHYSEGFEPVEGAAFVFHGSASGIADGSPATAAAQLEANNSFARFGNSVASAGDVNGDGYADVIVGAYQYNAVTVLEGAAFVFLGSASGIGDANPASPGVAQLESDQFEAFLGYSVASAGDVNGDGYADVIVGAPYYDAGQGSEGAAFVFLGGPLGIGDGNPSTAAAQLESNQSSAAFGSSVAGAGDVNGDGYADVVVGADYFDAGQENEGAAFVFLGSASGVSDGDASTAAAQLESDQSPVWLGRSVAGAGDVNGDGYADVLVGAIGYDAGQAVEGAAFVYHGNAGGRPVLARQRRGDGSGVPVQPWGTSLHPTDFRAEMRVSHPAGTGRVKLEFEACPPSLPFGEAGCVSATSPSWASVKGGTPEVLLAQTLSGLTPDTRYRWRARVLHAPTTGAVPANPAHGPWRRINAQATEADIHVPEPGAVASLASGIALLAALARRRASRQR